MTQRYFLYVLAAYRRQSATSVARQSALASAANANTDNIATVTKSSSTHGFLIRRSFEGAWTQMHSYLIEGLGFV